MNINKLRSEATILGSINKSPNDLSVSVIHILTITISRDIQNLSSKISTIKQKLANNKYNEHQLLSDETTNKLNRGDLISGGISLLPFPIFVPHLRQKSAPSGNSDLQLGHNIKISFFNMMKFC